MAVLAAPVRAGALRGAGRRRRGSTSARRRPAAGRRAGRRAPTAGSPASGCRVVNRRLAINRLKERQPGRRRRRPVPGPARGADRRGRPVHVPVARRGRRGAPRAAHRRAAGPDPAAPALGHRPVVPGARAARPGRGSKYQLEVRRGEHNERFNDPLNPKLSYSPMGTSSVCFAHGYATPDWTEPDPDARPGELTELVLPSRALRRDCPVTLYLPARFRRIGGLPAAGGARRRRLPAVRRGQDRAGQPDPPARRRRDWWSPSCTPRTGWPSTPTRRRTPGSSPGSWCRSWRPSCRWSASAPGAACSGPASVRSPRCPRPTGRRTCTARWP